MSVTIDKQDNIYINPPKPVCKECGTELFGGEVSGPEANGYCDGCN